jgi:hypothetical protein
MATAWRSSFGEALILAIRWGLLAVLPWAFFWGEAPEYRQWVRLGRP